MSGRVRRACILCNEHWSFATSLLPFLKMSAAGFPVSINCAHELCARDNAIGNLAKPLWGTTRPHAVRINSSITGIVSPRISTYPMYASGYCVYRIYAHEHGIGYPNPRSLLQSWRVVSSLLLRSIEKRGGKKRKKFPKDEKLFTCDKFRSYYFMCETYYLPRASARERNNYDAATQRGARYRAEQWPVHCNSAIIAGVILRHNGGKSARNSF